MPNGRRTPALSDRQAVDSDGKRHKHQENGNLIPAAVEFGRKIRGIRTRLRKSQRQLAPYLGVSDSTLARVELGILKPPRDVAFYERLSRIPGVTPDDMADLRNTGAIPPWLTAETTEDRSRARSHSRTVDIGDIGADGVRVQVYVEADPELYSELQVRCMAAILGSEVEVCLYEMLSRWSERNENADRAERDDGELGTAPSDEHGLDCPADDRFDDQGLSADEYRVEEAKARAAEAAVRRRHAQRTRHL